MDDEELHHYLHEEANKLRAPHRDPDTVVLSGLETREDIVSAIEQLFETHDFVQARVDSPIERSEMTPSVTADEFKLVDDDMMGEVIHLHDEETTLQRVKPEWVRGLQGYKLGIDDFSTDYECPNPDCDRDPLDDLFGDVPEEGDDCPECGTPLKKTYFQQ